MRYIGFKRLPVNVSAELIYRFMQQLKEKATEEQRGEAIQWAKSSVFTYRWFYDRKCSFICIFGIPDALVSLFDQVVSLPNSTDQDYDRESWEGILEKYAEKSPWYARTNAYEAIWDRFKEIFGNNGNLVVEWECPGCHHRWLEYSNSFDNCPVCGLPLDVEEEVQ